MKTKNSNLFKWMLGLVALTVVLGLVSQFAFTKTLQEDPAIIEKIEARLQQRFNNNNIQLDFDSVSVGPTETRVATFALPINQLTVGTTTGSIRLVTNPNATQITVTSHGQHKRPSATVPSSPEDLSFGTADVTIEVPESFTAPVKLKTVSGDIDIEQLQSETLEAVAVSGEVELKNISAKKTVIHSVSGDVEVQLKVPGELNINSISGEVELQLATSEMGYLFDVKSVSGEVKNSFKNSSSGTTSVVVTTTSGDIEIR